MFIYSKPPVFTEKEKIKQKHDENENGPSLDRDVNISSHETRVSVERHAWDIEVHVWVLRVVTTAERLGTWPGAMRASLNKFPA